MAAAMELFVDCVNEKCRLATEARSFVGLSFSLDQTRGRSLLRVSRPDTSRSHVINRPGRCHPAGRYRLARIVHCQEP